MQEQKKKVNEIEKDEKELVLRRVFSLCFLNTVESATYMDVLNPRRTSDYASAQDYTIVDHNYVTIKRKTRDLIIRSILDQPGATTLTQGRVLCYLIEWELMFIPNYTYSYKLDEEAKRLVRVENLDISVANAMVVIDECPRTKNPRVSFSVAFLKKMLPDLMGDSKFENLAHEKPVAIAKWPFKCVSCFFLDRQVILSPCNHVILCKCCADLLQPEECFVCKKAVLKIEEIHLS